MTAKRAIEPPPKMPNRTDSGNSELFAALYGEKLRFDHSRKRWLTLNGKRWEEDTQAQILLLARRTARYRLRFMAARLKGDKKEYPREVSWCMESEQRHRIRAVLDLAIAERKVSSSGQEFDKDPWLLGVENGVVVDLKTGMLREAKREDWITLSTNIRFDEDAICPRFDQFMHEIFEGDPETVEFVWRAIGYSLTGCVEEHCFFACYGTGANGKSSLLGVLQYVFGDYAFNLPFSAFELKQRSAIPNDLVRLESRRFVTAIETGQTMRLSEERIKTLTGGDRITARPLYKEFITFDPTHKIWLAFNHKPIIADDTPAMWRRVKLIPFNRKFDGKEEDKGLLEKLKAEAPGILAKAVRACLDWQRRGLIMPVSVDVATKEYREESDQIAAFFGEVCTLENGRTAPVAALYERYVAWANGAGEIPIIRKAFTQRLESKGLRKARQGHENVWVWEGIGLLITKVEG
jgi:putative DNA primase/helicase